MTVNRLSKRLDELEPGGGSIPELFMAWGREAGLDDAEIRAEWARIVDATGSGDPIGTAWDRSLKGELFNT